MTKRPLPADLQPMIDAAIDVARTRLEAGAEFPGIAFIDAPNSEADHPAQRMIAIPMSAIPSKDAWADLVRKVSGFSEARFVFVMSEVWVGPPVEKAEADRLIEEHGAVRNMPGRREAMLFQVETHDGFWNGFSYLKPWPVGAGRDAKTFDTPTMEAPTRNEGRLVGLLGRRNKGRAN